MENWLDVEGYIGIYKVSDSGRVKSLDRIDSNGRTRKGKVLNQTSINGYKSVNLSKECQVRRTLVHRIVAKAFLTQPDGCNIVNHIDNNPFNNCAENLEWTTYKGNMQHAAKQGRMRANYDNLRKAQESKKIPVVAVSDDGTRTRFDSQVDAAKELGISPKHIAACCRREYGYKKSYGYAWEYEDEKLQDKQKPNKTGMTPDEISKFVSKQMMGNKHSLGVVPSEETRKKISKACSKQIYQYSLNGELIKSYPSITEAKKTTGASSIGQCAMGRLKSSGGFIWKYKD